MRMTAIVSTWAVLTPLAAASVVNAAPEVRSVRVLTPRVDRYGRFELAADISGDWSNPFDPDQVDVSAEFLAPSGKRLEVPGFWHQAYEEHPPATEAREQIEGLTLFAYAMDWPDGTEVELFVDDICLLDERGREVPFDDMEEGDAPRAIGVDGSSVGFSTELVHGGERALRFVPTLSKGQHWPAAFYRPQLADWSECQGMVFWVYPRCDTPLGPLRSYYIDSEWGKSRMVTWEPRNGTLKANEWNRLEWRWPKHWPPVKLVPSGEPEWRVRFTPAETGRYTARLSATDGSGGALSEPLEFTVKPSKKPGFVRISEDDPHYFVFDNGTPFLPIGHDVPLGLPDVRECFPKMRANGENATYFILCPYDLSFEWDTLGVYDLEKAARIDRVFEAARENGIYLKLSFDVHDAWRASGWWAKSPYNATRGGPCASPNDLYTSPEAWDYYQKRIRYLSARWGHSTNMMAWEPVAELDGATVLGGIEGWGYTRRAGGDQVSAMLVPFLKKLAAHLDSIDPYDRLFTTSFGGDTSDDAHWSLPEVQYTQIHCYDPADPSETLSRWARDLTARYDKPMMVTEFGPGLDGPAPGIDPEGINLHNGIWASLLGGSAGSALNWHWEFIDAFDWYHHFRPLRAFATGIDWPREGFRPADLATQTPDQGRAMEVSTTITGLGGFGDVSVEEYPVRADGSLAALTPPPEFLLARDRSERRICPRFVVDFPRASTFAVDVRQVCPGARLELRVDDALVRAVDLPAEDVPGKTSVLDPTWDLWVCDYNETFSIDVPAGRHEIQVENAETNGSWIQVKGYQFIRQEPVSLQAIGLAGQSSVLVWVRNRESVWYNWDRPMPPAVTGAKLVLRGVPEGRLRVEWLDAWTGRRLRRATVVASGGTVTLDIPPVRRDVACRLRR
ncbi:MAG TPA: DUF5060 domain-containing protein [Armatimonadota bacterium]|nr:DUF5060 domain-containing protein [Armatimonadota bacterium]